MAPNAAWMARAATMNPDGTPDVSRTYSRESRMAACAVDGFYRLVFANERDFQEWTERMVEFAPALRELVPHRPELRPVIFVPLTACPGAPTHAYVSVGAREFGLHLSRGAKIDHAPVTLAELPAGLAMLCGDAIDAAEYEKRNA
jgi:hypothetical protein